MKMKKQVLKNLSLSLNLNRNPKNLNLNLNRNPKNLNQNQNLKNLNQNLNQNLKNLYQNLNQNLSLNLINWIQEEYGDQEKVGDLDYNNYILLFIFIL